MKIKLTSVKVIHGVCDHTLEGYDEDDPFMSDETLKRILVNVPDYQKVIDLYQQINEGQLAIGALSKIVSEMEL